MSCAHCIASWNCFAQQCAPKADTVLKPCTPPSPSPSHSLGYLRNTRNLGDQGLSLCHWRQKLVVVLSLALTKEKKLSSAWSPGLQPHIFQLYLAEIFLLMHLWSKQLRAPFSACWCVIGSEIPLCPKGSWLLGQRTLYLINGNLKLLRGHTERESLALFVRSAICWWETLGDRGCKGSERVSGVGVPGIPQ